MVAWQWDAKQARHLFDAQMILFAKTLAEMDLSHLPKELDDLEDLEEILPQKQQKKTFKQARERLSFVVFNTEGRRILSGDDNDDDFPFLTEKGFTKKIIDDDEWRLFMCPSHDGKNIIVVGQEREYRQEVVLRILLRHLSPWLILLPLFLIGLSIILYREFKPLRRLSTQLRQREAHDTTLLDESTLTPETRPLIQSLNALFTRISLLLQRERAFVSNAAHELRTPLAGLRVQAEVMELCHNDAKGRDNALQKILLGTARCTHLVEQLLLLSHIEATGPEQQAAKKSEKIDWPMLVTQAFEEVQENALSKSICMELLQTNQKLQQYGFAELWSIAVRNILDNALRYTPSGGRIVLSLDTKSLTLQNTAPHLHSDILAQLGQRFYRPAGQKEQGSGLGLAIVRHIATLHGAQVLMENAWLDGEQAIEIRIIFR